MKLTVIGSSSRGNCYALQSSTETLILEAGCSSASFKETLKFSYKPVVGVVISHEHGDHSRYAKQFSSMGATIYSTEEVIRKYGIEGFDIAVCEGQTYNVGSFRVTPFKVPHDVPCFGYLINHKEMGSLFFATDTFALPMAMRNVNHWLLEANYDDAVLEDNLRNGVIDFKQAQRLMVSHMSLENAIENLRQSHAEKAKTITLVHLSSRNSNAKDFQHRVCSEFGVPTFIAKRELEVNISKNL